jgi:hypothetical protein
VGSDVIVLSTPIFNNHPCFHQSREDFSIQKIVSQLAVE